MGCNLFPIVLYVLQSVFGEGIENKTDMYSLMKKEQVRHCEEMGSEVVVAVHWECRQSSLLCVYVCVFLD